MSLPKQLQNPEFRFVQLSRIFIGRDGKKGFVGADDWPNRGVPFNQIKKPPFFVLCGFGGLVVVDVDQCPRFEELNTVLQKAFDTFTVKTQDNGRHFYFVCRSGLSNETFKDGLGELRVQSLAVVGPECVVENGGKYSVWNNSPVQEVTADKLLKVLRPFIKLVKNSDTENSKKPSQKILLDENPSETERGSLVMRWHNDGMNVPEIVAKIMREAAWGDLNETKTREKVLGFVSRYGNRPGPWKKTSSGQAKSWEQEKARAVQQYRISHEAYFPEHVNFSADLNISASVESKATIQLVVPYKIPTKDGKIKGLKFFDDPMPRGAIALREQEVIADFFESQTVVNGVPSVLFSTDQITESEVHVKGLLTRLSDYRKVGERSSIPVAKKIILVSHVSPPTIAVEEIRAATKINSTEEFLENYWGILRQPDDFEKLVVAWNLAFVHRYPLHLCVGDVNYENEVQGGIGKTEMQERILLVNGEEPAPFDGAGMGTPKGLIISFKGERIDPGYLLSQPFVACVDEFFALLDKLDRDSKQEDFLKNMTALLEHRNRITKSGNTAPTRVRPTSRVLISGNLPNGVENLGELLNRVFPPFLQRLAVYFYDKEHRGFIGRNRTIVEKSLNRGLHRKIGVPVAKYLRYAVKIPLEFTPETEAGLENVIKEVYSAAPNSQTHAYGSPVLANKRLASFFERRYPHHVRCLFDGLMKVRHLDQFNAHLIACLEAGQVKPWQIAPEPQDFEELTKIVSRLVVSWA